MNSLGIFDFLLIPFRIISCQISGYMKKLPPNSEASNVLVGEVDFLTRPIAAFIRLQQSVVLGDLTEIPIPTRFLFIMMGPSCNPGKYHEVGRAVSTLMADEVCTHTLFVPDVKWFLLKISKSSQVLSCSYFLLFTAQLSL